MKTKTKTKKTFTLSKKWEQLEKLNSIKEKQLKEQNILLKESKYFDDWFLIF